MTCQQNLEFEDLHSANLQDITAVNVSQSSC